MLPESEDPYTTAAVNWLYYYDWCYQEVTDSVGWRETDKVPPICSWTGASFIIVGIYAVGNWSAFYLCERVGLFFTGQLLMAIFVYRHQVNTL